MMRRKFSSAASAASIGLRSNGAGRKRVAAEQDASRRFLDRPDRSIRRDLGDDEANGARTHVEDRDELWRRCGRVGVAPEAVSDVPFGLSSVTAGEVRLTIAKKPGSCQVPSAIGAPLHGRTSIRVADVAPRVHDTRDSTWRSAQRCEKRLAHW